MSLQGDMAKLAGQFQIDYQDILNHLPPDSPVLKYCDDTGAEIRHLIDTVINELEDI